MYKVYKFGGASLRNASGFRNVASILDKNRDQNILLIISALGKTTNELEEVVNRYFFRKGNAAQYLEKIKQDHYQILRDLFQDQNQNVFNEVNNAFVEIDWILEDEPHDSYDYLYDQIVSIGEMASSKMVAAYLNQCSMPAAWVDVRDCIRTDNNYREGRVDWEITKGNIMKNIPPLSGNQFVVTQGFIGGSAENFTTTLGREGSDYSAAIFGYALNAVSVTIWKDVEGILTADPKYFPDAGIISRLSYYEAIEMAYYGASVIHPKTIKPLQNKKIPLWVRGFHTPEKEGTLITEAGEITYPPVIVLKHNQILLSLYPKDFSFIAEDNLSHIFIILSRHRLKVNLMQNSALSFSICTDLTEKVAHAIAELKNSFAVLTNEDLELLTLRHYTRDLINRYTEEKEILLEQRSRQTVQFVMKK